MAAAAPTLAPVAETREDLELAPRWKVLLQNDPETTFEFVIDLLVNLFRKQRSEAVRLTHEVHESGSAVITVTSFERAELYVEQVHSMARTQGYPLTASIERA